MLMFRAEDRERVARGEITVSFRLWKSAHVKAGKRYETGFGTVEVDDVQVLPAAMIDESDVAPVGLRRHRRDLGAGRRAYASRRYGGDAAVPGAVPVCWLNQRVEDCSKELR